MQEALKTQLPLSRGFRTRLTSGLLRLSLMFALALNGANAVAQQWSVGEEREVDEGVYVTLFAENLGWRIWRSERKTGIRCYAVKASNGLEQPTPAGFGDILNGPTPYMRIDSRRAVLVGRFGNGGEWRAPSERFWNVFPSDVLSFPDDGSAIEVHIDTYRYPNLRQGIMSERGEIDLSGLTWAAQQVGDCDSSRPPN